jgi:uncharacterized SAM-binding protein YcdF (DUF218 family)
MKKKLKYILLALLLVTAIFVFTDVYLVFLGPLEIGTDIGKNYGDSILVLGGGLRKGPEIGYSTEERLLLAVELFHQKKRTVIVSDGSLYRRSPAIKKMIDFLVVKGIPKDYIRLEGKSQTTYDNFFYTKDIIKKINSKEVIVCTSPYHQKRAELIMKYLEIGDFKVAEMKQSEIYQADSIKQRFRNMRLIIREYMGIIKFKLFGK